MIKLFTFLQTFILTSVCKYKETYNISGKYEGMSLIQLKYTYKCKKTKEKYHNEGKLKTKKNKS